MFQEKQFFHLTKATKSFRLNVKLLFHFNGRYKNIEIDFVMRVETLRLGFMFSVMFVMAGR